jgi:hypothetical protein
MPAKKITKPTWTAIRQHIKSWESDALIALIKDLHDSSPTNRDFLNARVTATQGGGVAFSKYRKRVVDPFYPARGDGNLKLGEARKAIREYRKATGDIPGTIELLLVFCETGAKFTNEFGDIDERFYDTLGRGLNDLCELVKTEGRGAWEIVRERLDKLAIDTHGIGWGYSDDIHYFVNELRNEFESSGN